MSFDSNQPYCVVWLIAGQLHATLLLYQAQVSLWAHHAVAAGDLPAQGRCHPCAMHIPDTGMSGGIFPQILSPASKTTRGKGNNKPETTRKALRQEQEQLHCHTVTTSKCIPVLPLYFNS